MWVALAYVTGPFSLIAFMFAAWMRHLSEKSAQVTKRIESCPPEDRSALVAELVRSSKLPTHKLGTKEQYQLLLDSSRKRKSRFKTTTYALGVMGIVSIVVLLAALVAVSHVNDRSPATSEGSDFRHASPSHHERAVDGDQSRPMPMHSTEVGHIKSGDRANIRIGNGSAANSVDVGVDEVITGSDSTVKIGDH